MRWCFPLPCPCACVRYAPANRLRRARGAFAAARRDPRDRLTSRDADRGHSVRKTSCFHPPPGVNGGHAGRPGPVRRQPGPAPNEAAACPPMSDGNVLAPGATCSRLSTSAAAAEGPSLRSSARARCAANGRGRLRVRRRGPPGGLRRPRRCEREVLEPRGHRGATAPARRAGRMFHRNGYFGPPRGGPRR